MCDQALDYIQRADIVHYLVLDNATEAFIQLHAKKAADLYQYYDTEKNRLTTYTQMAEIMVNSVREGNLTVAVLYGHPGIFVCPSHRAIAICKEEGYEAKMLPGISAADCLFADLGIDPSTHGCMMIEATLMLFGEGRLDPRNHLIIWQPGAVGKAQMVFDNEYLPRIADYLEPVYGADFPIIAYLGAMRPLEKPRMDRITVGDLRRKDGPASWINACTTLYLPPKELPQLRRPDLGFEWQQSGKAPDAQALLPTSAYRISYPDMAVASLYNSVAQAAVDALKEWKYPAAIMRNREMHASPALRRAAMKLALLHHRVEHLPGDQIGKLIASEPGLTDEERAKLRGNIYQVDQILKNKPVTLSTGPYTKPPTPSVQIQNAADEVDDIFEAVIEEGEELLAGAEGGAPVLRRVALVR